MLCTCCKWQNDLTIDLYGICRIYKADRSVGWALPTTRDPKAFALRIINGQLRIQMVGDAHPTT